MGRHHEKEMDTLVGNLFHRRWLAHRVFWKKICKNVPFWIKKEPVSEIDGRLVEHSIMAAQGAGVAEASLGLAILSREPMTASAFYNGVASGYAAIDPGRREWFYPQAHDAFDRQLIDTLSEGGHVLDLGCGVGANIARIKAMNLPYTSYTGLDITDAMLKYAQKRYGNLPNVVFHRLNLMTDPLPEGRYDLIISTWVFEHLSDPVSVTEKAWEKLKPGGKMVLLVETQGRSFSELLTGLIYPLIGAHRIREDEYRRFPGFVVQEDHFVGPFGRLTLLVLQKPD